MDLDGYILMDGSKWTINDNEGFSSDFAAVCNMSTYLPKPEVSINQIKDLMQSIDRQQKESSLKDFVQQWCISHFSS